LLSQSGHGRALNQTCGSARRSRTRHHFFALRDYGGRLISGTTDRCLLAPAISIGATICGISEHIIYNGVPRTLPANISRPCFGRQLEVIVQEPHECLPDTSNLNKFIEYEKHRFLNAPIWVVERQLGMGAHLYLITRSMRDEYFYNADGEMLFVPQQGELRLWTEFGIIDIEPGEIAVIPRGVKIRVELGDGPARGYLCENYGGAFALPERGPIGANCLANQRDFLTPVAAYEERDDPGTMFVKWGGNLWAAPLDHSPLDVIAWHGNYAPYKYDLRRYSPVGPILFDHADPSIFTVLTSPSETLGTANIDFVIFPDRWLVAENTFRPPWYHMNVMSEFMGLIYGQYDAKPQGFAPGRFSLHNTMLPHGPDVDAFEGASNAELKPHKLEGTMAFMFETRFPQRVTAFAAQSEALQKSYGAYGHRLKKHFNPKQR
jgi:homogentisate 1,2-dioxygenase